LHSSFSSSSISTSCLTTTFAFPFLAKGFSSAEESEEGSRLTFELPEVEFRGLGAGFDVEDFIVDDEALGSILDDPEADDRFDFARGASSSDDDEEVVTLGRAVVAPL
jgi:hypothetical protein